MTTHATSTRLSLWIAFIGDYRTQREPAADAALHEQHGRAPAPHRPHRTAPAAAAPPAGAEKRHSPQETPRQRVPPRRSRLSPDYGANDTPRRRRDIAQLTAHARSSTATITKPNTSRSVAATELAHVVAETAMRGVNGADPAPHRAEFERLLDREVTGLDDAERLAIVTALSHLDSSTTWVTMRHELGMRGRDIADAAAWAAEAVLDPLRGRAHQG